MKYDVFKGLLSSSVVLVKRTIEEFSPELQSAIDDGAMHSHLYHVVDEYLKANGIRADRKTLNVLTDRGKEYYIDSIANSKNGVII